MNILVLSNKDIASCFALNRLIPALTIEHDVHLWLSARVGNSSSKPNALKELSYLEQEFFNSEVQALLAKSDSNNYKYFDGLISQLSSPIREENKINSPDSIEKINGVAPDLIISIRFGGILKEDVINIPQHGVINLHSGILPHYRGVMATFWAMHNGEKEIGTTLHTIDDSSIDTGNILKISRQPINQQNSYLTNVLNLYIQGTLDILESVQSLSTGNALASFSQPAGGGYYSFPEHDNLERFQSMNYALVNTGEYVEFLNRYFLSGDALKTVNTALR